MAHWRIITAVVVAMMWMPIGSGLANQANADPVVESFEWLGLLGHPASTTPDPVTGNWQSTSFFMRGINNAGNFSYNYTNQGFTNNIAVGGFMTLGAGAYVNNQRSTRTPSGFGGAVSVATGMSNFDTVLFSDGSVQGNTVNSTWRPPGTPFLMSTFPSPVQNVHAISAGVGFAVTREGDDFSHLDLNDRRGYLAVSNIDYATGVADVAIHRHLDTTGNGVPDTWDIEQVGRWALDRGSLRNGGGPRINNQEQFTYNVRDSDTGSSTAFLWEDGAAQPLIFTSGAAHQRAYGLNNSGQIVGEAGPDRANRAAHFWHDGQSYSLTNLAMDHSGGGTLWTANDISPNGWIIGQGQGGIYRMKIRVDAHIWDLAEDGAFHQPSQWTQYESPTTNHTAMFREDGYYTVDFRNSVTNHELRLTGQGGHVTFALAYDFGDDEDTALLTDIGDSSTPMAISSGLVRYTYSLDHGLIAMDQDDDTSLRITEGMIQFNESLKVGKQGNGTLLIDGTGAKLISKSSTTLGEHGYGLLWIRDGGEAEITEKIKLGINVGANGNVLVEDEDSALSVKGDLTIGDMGIGNVSVLDAGKIETMELKDDDDEVIAEGKTKIASALGSQGRLVVSGEDALFISKGGLTVGDGGNGELDIADQGWVEIQAGAKFGSKPVSFGIGTVAGQDSLFTVDGKLTLGDGGTGELTVSDNAAASARSIVLGGQINAIGELTIVGPLTHMHVDESVVIGEFGQGTLRVLEGASFTAESLLLGQEALATTQNQLWIDGADSFVHTGDTIIGGEGIAKLEIRDGGSLASGRLPVFDSNNPDLIITSGVQASATLGQGLFSHGQVLVTGENSQWEVGGELIVGDGGFGELQVEWGGTLLTHGARLGATELEGPGHVTVINDGSLWQSLDEIIIAGTALGGGGSGGTGQGILSVLDGARVEAPAMTLGIGGLIFGDSQIVLDGGAGTLNNEGGVLAPGASPGSLTLVGNYSQHDDGVLELEIAGLLPGQNYDQLIITGDADFGGTIRFIFLNEFAPKQGDLFDLVRVSGDNAFAFDHVIFENLEPGFEYDFQINNGQFQLIALSDAAFIPEPGAATILLTAALMLFRRQQPVTLPRTG